MKIVCSLMQKDTGCSLLNAATVFVGSPAFGGGGMHGKLCGLWDPFIWFVDIFWGGGQCI